MRIEKQVKRGDFMFECTFKNSDVFMPSNLVYDLILCHPVSLCEVSDGIVCVSLLVRVLLFISLPLLMSPFTFIEKSDFGKINLVLSVISIITVLVKLL